MSTRGERYRGETSLHASDASLTLETANIEMKQDLRESSMAHAAEQADLNAEIRQLRNAQNIAGVPQGLGDMTEDEAVRARALIHAHADSYSYLTIGRPGYHAEQTRRGGATESNVVRTVH